MSESTLSRKALWPPGAPSARLSSSSQESVWSKVSGKSDGGTTTKSTLFLCEPGKPCCGWWVRSNGLLVCFKPIGDQMETCGITHRGPKFESPEEASLWQILPLSRIRRTNISF